MSEEIAGDKLAPKPAGKHLGLVDRAAGGGATGNLVPIDYVEETICVGVMQRTMLAETLAVRGTLQSMHERAPVGAVEKLAMLIESKSVGVAATLAKKFKAIRAGMVSPDPLLELDVADPAGRGTSVDPVKPAVRAPGQVVCQ